MGNGSRSQQEPVPGAEATDDLDVTDTAGADVRGGAPDGESMNDKHKDELDL